MYILNNPPRLAKLLASIKVNYKIRPLSPIDVSKEINIMLKDLEGDEKELHRRLPITQDMTRQYNRLLRLPPEIQGMVIWGDSNHDTGEIGFSVATRIASLKNQDDMRMMAGTITEMARPITTNEINEILSLKNNNPNKTLKECLEEVITAVRVTVITHYIFLSGLDPDIAKSLKMHANNANEDVHKFTSKILSSIFPEGSFKSSKVFADCIRLTLGKHGSDFISTYARSHNIPIQKVLNHMLDSKVIIHG